MDPAFHRFDRHTVVARHIRQNAFHLGNLPAADQAQPFLQAATQIPVPFHCIRDAKCTQLAMNALVQRCDLRQTARR